MISNNDNVQFPRLFMANVLKNNNNKNKKKVCDIDTPMAKMKQNGMT